MTLANATSTLMLAVLLVSGSVVDIRSMRLPDWMTLGLLVAGLLIHAAAPDGALWEHAAAAAAGFIAFWAVGEFYRRRTGAVALGLGDAKLLAAAGAWLGPLALAPVVLAASLLALIFVGTMHLVGHGIERHSALPFGPFLSAAFAAGWGATLVGWM